MPSLLGVRGGLPEVERGAAEGSRQGPGTHLRAPSSSHHGAAIMRGANQACRKRGGAAL